jgi:archaellum component FlaC
MAEVTNDLIYEVLKSMQGRMSNIEHKLGEMDNRLTSISGQLRGLSLEMNAAHTDVANVYVSLGHLDGRLMRIERRLDIVEEPAE